MMKDILILDALRTPVGSPYKSLRHISVAEMAGLLTKTLAARSGVRPADVQEVVWGNAVGAGTGQNFARQAVIRAGLPVTTRAYTVNNVCGSGLESLIAAGRGLASGELDLAVAGGAESVSLAPQLIFPKHTFSKDTRDEAPKPVESRHYDGLLCQMTGKRMGDLCEQMIREENISRRAQDEFSVDSYRKGYQAQQGGKFLGEIVPVPVGGKDVQKDDRIRKEMTMAELEKLQPAFDPKGTLTAGNTAAPSDGAAAVLVASPAYAAKRKLAPRARILGYASVALDPKDSFRGMPSAVQACLQTCGLALKDIDLFEVSEAFAASALYARDALKVPPAKMNIFGGDVALGHPLGAAGSRILVTLVHALKDQKKNKGLAVICFGSGGAIAVAIERCS